MRDASTRQNLDSTRRELIKRAWVAPVVLRWPVTPSMARAGSQVEAEDPGSWTVDYSVRGDISQVNKFYGTGAWLFLKGPETTVYLQSGGWTFQGIYGQVTLPDGVPLIVFTGA